LQKIEELQAENEKLKQTMLGATAGVSYTDKYLRDAFILKTNVVLYL